MRRTKIGRYELLHKIAAGGMAEVFLARQWGQAGFFRDVVIKRLFPHYAEHEHALRMFQDEARLLAELSHPNIPQVYDLGHADGYWYLAMEHVGGASLADLCHAAAKAEKPLPHPVAIGIVQQVGLALHHAHERRDREGRALRIVHRDVTPQNIMISLDAVVKVLDFGVAQTSARIDTDAGAVRGTYAYMAPEQVRGKPLDKRADVFALGVNLYELTTGRRLFRGTDVEIMTAVVERDVTPPSRFVRNYPPDLEEIVMTALHRDRSQRTPSAAHLALALDQFCMRHSVVTGSLVVSHFVRSVFPYERAHEAGLGIAHPDAEPSDEELEERMLAEELRTIGAAVASDAAAVVQSVRDDTPDTETEIEELSLDEVVLEDEEGAAARALPSGEDSLGLDAFDEDSDVKPVVLLSPKAKGEGTDGAFLGDLERRLREDADGSE
ncbi:MAG: serine/threonine-protein kinase [Myxococcales bacterium]|nr:serine/threonine-protein kinase [Myxococcales bacterium]